MSGLSKEQVEALIAAIPPSALPVELEFVTSDEPFVPQARKIYVVSDILGWTKDLVINVPNSRTVERGYSFEVISGVGQGAYNAQLFLASELDQWIGNGITNDPALPVTLDIPLQHYRFMATGLVVVPGAGEASGWLVSRMNVPLLSETRLVEYATTGVLPAFSNAGDKSQHVLTASGAGVLSIDGHDMEVGESLLVKNQPGAATAEHNGIYKVIQENPWKLRRRSDFCFNEQLVLGANIVVLNGNENSGRRFHIPPWDDDLDNADLTIFSSGDGDATLFPTSLVTDEYAGVVGERVPYNPVGFTGNKRITFPPSPKIGDRFGIQNVTNSDALINVYSAAQSIQDPLTGFVTTSGTDFPIGIPKISIAWEYMPSGSGNAWHIIDISFADPDLPIHKAYNGDVATILSGHAVYIFSTSQVKRAIATSSALAAFVGAALHDIAVSDPGAIAVGGIIRIPSGLQEGSWGAGNRIYLSDSTAGQYRNSPPTTVGRFIVPIGRVIMILSGTAFVIVEKGEILEIT